MIVDVVIPALDEAAALPDLLAAIPRDRVRDIVVVDNGSRDRTADVARAGGATVITEPRRGYGAACLAGVRHLRARPPQIVVFLDTTALEHAVELPALLAPIEEGRADLVLGARPPRLPVRAATALIGALYGHHYRDLGPFRAIRWQALAALGMADEGLGFAVEMQVKAVRAGLSIEEVPLRNSSQRPVELASAARASGRILFTILRYSTSR